MIDKLSVLLVLLYYCIIYPQGLSKHYETKMIVLNEVAPLTNFNYWVYSDYSGIVPDINIMRVIDTAKYINNIKYFEVEINGGASYLYRLREDGFYVMRRDSSYDEVNHEQIYYKKDAHLGDTWEVKAYSFPPETLYYTIVDTAQVVIFGKTITIKILNINTGPDGLLNKDEIWSEEFGMLSEDHDEGFTDNLKGCIIDNELYGDTSITSVKGEVKTISTYMLYQNYPNPFNPQTTIEYKINKGGNIKLEVFNILGEKVVKLIDEYQMPGNYKVIFADNISAGIFFYKLTCKEGSITKKMIIQK